MLYIQVWAKMGHKAYMGQKEKRRRKAHILYILTTPPQTKGGLWPPLETKGAGPHTSKCTRAKG
jgi:hypothetical protein